MKNYWTKEDVFEMFDLGLVDGQEFSMVSDLDASGWKTVRVKIPGINVFCFKVNCPPKTSIESTINTFFRPPSEVRILRDLLYNVMRSNDRNYKPRYLGLELQFPKLMD